MSVRWFHAFFIALCVLLAVFVAVWAFEHAQWLLALIAVTGGAALVMYRRVFLNKTEGLEQH